MDDLHKVAELLRLWAEYEDADVGQFCGDIEPGCEEVLRDNTEYKTTLGLGRVRLNEHQKAGVGVEASGRCTAAR
jgi:hypothetical protein